MPNMGKIGKVEAPELYVFCVLDTSGSMEEERIGVLNDTMRSTINELKSLHETMDEDLKIGVLEFNSTSRWITVDGAGNPAVLNLNEFYWSDLSAYGFTRLGDALAKLNMQLKEIQNDKIGAKKAIIIFISDGTPTDIDRWKSELEALRNNPLYKQAGKIAYALGDDADADVLAEVVGTREKVIPSSELAHFRKMIRSAIDESLAQSRSVHIPPDPDPVPIPDPAPNPDPSPYPPFDDDPFV